MEGGPGPEGHPLPPVGEEPLQAVDVCEEEEELRRLPDVLLVPGEPGHLVPKPWIPYPDRRVELGARVGGGPLEGEEELFQVLLGKGKGLEAAYAPPSRQDV